MSSDTSLLLRLADFTRIPLITPRLLELGIRSGTALPTIILVTHSFYYYADFLQSQTLEFYDTSHIDTFDFIVVGGGSAGAVVANRLSLHNRVLLLELGGDPHPLSYIPLAASALQRSPSTDLMFETLPQNKSCHGLRNNIMFWPRGTGIGGSSNLNFMIYQRGNPRDYDNWGNITQNEDWSSQNVFKVFKQMDDYHGAYPNPQYHRQGGPMRVEKSRQTFMADYFLKAATEKGFHIGDTNAGVTQEFAEMDVTNYNGLRWSTFPGYIEPILGRKNLKISRYSRVVKIHLDRHRHAYGVTYYRHGLKKFVRASKEIIVSAGAVDSPKLLMLSGIGPMSHLHSVGLKCRVNLPVGNNLQDHLFTLVGPFVFSPGVNSSLHPYRDVNLHSLIQYTSQATGPLASISTISAVGFYPTTQTQDHQWPDVQYFQLGFGLAKGFGTGFEHVANMKAELVEDYIQEIVGRHSNTVIQVLVRPKSRGWIRLAGSDPLVKPRIEPNYFGEPSDLQATVEGMKFMVDMFENTSTYRSLGATLNPRPLKTCAHLKMKSDAYYACVATTLTQTLYHPTGTVPMGRDDYYQNIQATDNNTSTTENAVPAPVVDSHLRVFKATGLRIIDASIMPVIVNSNTNIPSIMIGEVGSEFVRRYWTQQSEVCPSFHYLISTVNFHVKTESCFYKRIY